MDKVSLVVKGKPLSIQAQAASRHRWMRTVQQAARTKFTQPLQDEDLWIRITYFCTVAPNFDIDNVSKPICDALNGIAYVDDHQLADRNTRKRAVRGSYRLEGVAPDLIEALAEQKDFVYIEIGSLGAEVDQL